MKRKILKFLIDRAKRSKLIQSVFEQPLDIPKLPVKGVFVDSRGNEHKLHEGLRSKIKPGWQKYFAENKTGITQEQIDRYVENGRISVERIAPVISLYNDGGIKDKKILEIGCHSGAAAYAFLERGAGSVTGSEFSGYKVQATKGGGADRSDLKTVEDKMIDLRKAVEQKYNSSLNVNFVDDDICSTTLDSDTYDLICSWDVLEHLHDPVGAFKSIRSLLKDDGISVHDYNPFFSLVGGHSACTLDFPWGHVTLPNNDFIRFNQEHQPEKSEKSISFYQKGINRMSMKGLKSACKDAGMEILSLIPFPKEQNLRMLNSKILELAISNYPDVTVNDLISSRIIVVMKKAKSS